MSYLHGPQPDCAQRRRLCAWVAEGAAVQARNLVSQLHSGKYTE